MQRFLAAIQDSSDANSFLEMTELTEEGADPIAGESQVDKVLGADPHYVPALMARAAILLQRGQSEAAATTYSEVLRRFPDFASAQKRLAALHAADPVPLKRAILNFSMFLLGLSWI